MRRSKTFQCALFGCAIGLYFMGSLVGPAGSLAGLALVIGLRKNFDKHTWIIPFLLAAFVNLPHTINYALNVGINTMQINAMIWGIMQSLVAAAKAKGIATHGDFSLIVSCVDELYSWLIPVTQVAIVACTIPVAIMGSYVVWWRLKKRVFALIPELRI